MDLLNKRSYCLIVFVTNRPYADEVDIDSADDIFACDSRMLLRKLFVADPRDNELVFAWLAPVYVVVGIEKRPVVYHERHLVSLVDYPEVTVPVQWCDLHLAVIARQDFHLVAKVLNELLRHYVLYLYLAYVQCGSTAFPDLVLHEIVLLIGEDDGDLALAG